MKAAISSVFCRPVSLFRKIGSPVRKAGNLLSKIGFVFGKIGSLFATIGSWFRKIGSLLGGPIRRLRLLPPFGRIYRALHGPGKGPKRLQYRFLPYVTSVLRVLGWAVLIIGVLASIVLGLEIIDDVLMVLETELRGVGMGVSVIILGIIGSFLAWLFLLVARELVCLFIHVKENTRNTADSITE
jgi:hypothetical protein